MISVNKLHHRHDNTGRMLSVVWYVAQCRVVCCSVSCRMSDRHTWMRTLLSVHKEQMETNLCIMILLWSEDGVMEQQLESFLHVVVTEIFKRSAWRPAAVCWITEARSINNHNGRHHAIVWWQCTEKSQSTALSADALLKYYIAWKSCASYPDSRNTFARQYQFSILPACLSTEVEQVL